MIPRRQRLTRRQRRDRLVWAGQMAGLEAVAGGDRGPLNLREDLYLQFLRMGLNPDPRDFVLSRPLALAEQAEARAEARDGPTEA